MQDAACRAFTRTNTLRTRHAAPPASLLPFRALALLPLFTTALLYRCLAVWTRTAYGRTPHLHYSLPGVGFTRALMPPHIPFHACHSFGRVRSDHGWVIDTFHRGCRHAHLLLRCSSWSSVISARQHPYGRYYPFSVHGLQPRFLYQPSFWPSWHAIQARALRQQRWHSSDVRTYFAPVSRVRAFFAALF